MDNFTILVTMERTGSPRQSLRHARSFLDFFFFQAEDGIRDEIEIFEMQIDFESRREITSQYLLGFLIETFASSESAAQSTNHLLWIDSRFRSKHQCFADCSQVDGDDDLIRKLRETAGAQRPHMRNRFSKGIEHGQRPFEVFRLTTSHDRQCA